MQKDLPLIEDSGVFSKIGPLPHADHGRHVRSPLHLIFHGGLQMKRVTIVLLGILIITASHVGYGMYADTDKDAIEKTVFEFMDRCMNNFEVEAVNECFHPDFIGLSMEKDEIDAATRSVFADYVKKMKNKAQDESRAKRIAKILSSRTVKDIGFAAFETYGGNERLGTDFMVLLKTDGQWQFIRSATLYHSQEENIDNELEQEKIKEIVQASLVDAAGNDWDLEKWKKGFHPEFTGLTRTATQLEKDTYADWEKIIKTMEAKKKPGGDNKPLEGKISRVDVLGHMGIVEVNIHYRSELSETAYIIFFKFSDGWKVISKVGVSHR
jgi:hypothetical protein